MSRNADCDLNQPVVVVLGPEYGSKAGQKIHVKTIQYSLTGPVVSFPGTFGSCQCPEHVKKLNESGGGVTIEAIQVESTNVGALQPIA